MQYFINPDNIFFDWSILKNQHKNIHFISKDELIYRTINNISYYDHIEMSSFYNSTIISYGHDENENLKVIDPKQCYTRKVSFPRHLMKGLKGIDYLDIFLKYMREIDYESAKKWEMKFEEYCNEEE